MHHNFGVVVHNDTYSIYRSAELGKDGLEDLSRLPIPFPKTIVYMNAEGYAFPFYFAIQEWKAQEKYGFKYFHSFGSPRTYLDGQNPYEPTDVIDKFIFLGPTGKKYFSYGDGKVTGGIDQLVQVLELVLDPANQPVLFHCFGGYHRTGMVAMVIRALQGWSMDAIVREYRYYNPLHYRENNVLFIEKFQQDEKFKALKEKYGKALQ